MGCAQLKLDDCYNLAANVSDETLICCWNHMFGEMQAPERISWSLEHLRGVPVLTSSFGAQSAVSLHMITREMPDIPVILIDTGYLFPETYAFVDELTQRLDLNLKVYQSRMSPAWQEARYGKRWNNGLQGLEEYSWDNKIEPMQRAVRVLDVGVWFSGLRRDQSSSRAEIPFIQLTNGYYKVCALADWTDRDVYNYLQANDLPYHPLWDKGFVSIGDVHSTASLNDVDSIEETRFFGLKRECGLHELEG